MRTFDRPRARWLVLGARTLCLGSCRSASEAPTSRRVYDLNHACDAETDHWPTAGSFELRSGNNGPLRVAAIVPGARGAWLDASGSDPRRALPPGSR